MTKPRHQWRVVGRDFNTTVPNIWKCKRCEMFKSECWDVMPEEGKLLNPRIEFTDQEGEVLGTGVRKHVKIPSCCE